MSKLYVAIVYGGRSLEHDISLQSAENIFHMIDRNRFKIVMIRVGKNGVWYIDNVLNELGYFSYLKSYLLNVFGYCSRNRQYQGSFRCNEFVCMSHNRSNIHYDFLSKIDVVFPIIHGRGGEDGSLQGLLSMKQIPFVGSGILGSSISMDKDISKRLLRESGLTIAPFMTLNRSDYILKNISFEYYADNLGLPLFIKPSSQGSSIGVFKVVDSKNFYKAIDCAFNLDCKILIESAIIGRELECAVLGNKNPEVSVCGEVILDDIFYTYRSKYFHQSGIKVVIPAKIDREIDNDIRCVVLRAFNILQCYGMARVDIFLTSDGRIVVNEVNTLPGFTVTSMYPKLWEASGLSCKDLISTLIDLALEVHEENKRFVNCDPTWINLLI